MTEPSDKELAEFVAKLLKISNTIHPPVKSKYFEFDPDFKWQDIAEQIIFHDRLMSPYYRHLIEEEMASREWYWHVNNSPSGIRCHMNKGYDERFMGQDKNKTRAVALAAWRALK